MTDRKKLSEQAEIISQIAKTPTLGKPKEAYKMLSRQLSQWRKEVTEPC